MKRVGYKQETAAEAAAPITSCELVAVETELDHFFSLFR
jgi:hypothetical protein